MRRSARATASSAAEASADSGSVWATALAWSTSRRALTSVGSPLTPIPAAFAVARARRSTAASSRGTTVRHAVESRSPAARMAPASVLEGLEQHDAPTGPSAS